MKLFFRSGFITIALLILGVLFISCGKEKGAAPPPPPTTTRISIITTTDILADIVKNIAGDRASVSPLITNGKEPHSYEPTPQDVVTIAKADLIMAFGAGLEDEWLTRLVSNAHEGASTILLTDGLPLAKQITEYDPHIWMDPQYVIKISLKIRDALSQKDPAGAEIYKKNTEEYTKKLLQLDAWIKTKLENVPVEKRRLVTTHEFLGYYANAYGLTVIGTVLPANPHGEPSAADLKNLIQTIQKEHVSTLFAETSMSPKTLQTIAGETGSRVETKLLAETLGAPGSGAETYLDFMHHNTNLIVTGLMATP